MSYIYVVYKMSDICILGKYLKKKDRFYTNRSVLFHCVIPLFLILFVSYISPEVTCHSLYNSVEQYLAMHISCLAASK